MIDPFSFAVGLGTSAAISPLLIAQLGQRVRALVADNKRLEAAQERREQPWHFDPEALAKTRLTKPPARVVDAITNLTPEQWKREQG